MPGEQSFFKNPDGTAPESTANTNPAWEELRDQHGIETHKATYRTTSGKQWVAHWRGTGYSRLNVGNEHGGNSETGHTEREAVEALVKRLQLDGHWRL